MESLNRQSFPAVAYSRVDDVIVFALFASKRRNVGCRSLDPAPVSFGRDVTSDEGIHIRKICQQHIEKALPTRDQCREVAEILPRQFPHLLAESEKAVIEQWVSILRTR